jgi:flavin-dependent dehydrogenase
MQKIYDVAIIGGGPAGSTAATILSKAGRSVIVLERERFPRFHIGESLLPYSLPVLERLGVRELMDQNFLQKHGAELATACGERQIRFYFDQGFRLDHTSAYQVERAVFDEILLKNSENSGAAVYQETSVTSVELGPDAARLTLSRNSGMPPHTASAGAPDSGPCGDCGGIAPSEIMARYVIDASGRNTLLGSQLKLKRPYPNLQKFSVFAHYEGVQRDAGRDGTLTRMVRAQDRWFWMIPIGADRMSIGMVMDSADFRKLRLSPEVALSEAIAEQPVILSRMTHARRISPVHATGDYSYRNAQFAGNRWLLAGDAAGFIDPVFSTGVFLALNSGEAAADAVHEALEKPGRRTALFRKYQYKLNRVMDLYLRFVDAWYRHEFAEVISLPEPRFQLAAAINSVLAGRIEGGLATWWRMQLFYIVVFFQRFYPLCPRLDLRPRRFQPSDAQTRGSEEPLLSTS